MVKGKLIADGNQVSVSLHLPNSSDPKKEEWLETLANKIKN